MSSSSILNPVEDWRVELPVLTGQLSTLREACADDAVPLVSLLQASDAPGFGFDEPINGATIQPFIEYTVRERRAGRAFTYAIASEASRGVVGLLQVRRLDLTFETAEWECTIAPLLRGTGIFLDAAQLMGSFAFGVVGTRRLEARVLQRNGRGNGAMRKLGAVQEGVLRRSVRRGQEYCDQVLWSLLIEDWRDRWMPSTAAAGRVH